MHNSTESVVVLSSVQLSSTGTYRCEVSGEAPFFETVTDHQKMTVVGKSLTFFNTLSVVKTFFLGKLV